MSLKNLCTEQIVRPPRILLYGQPGIGKTCWAADAPEPVFVLTEDGLLSVDPTPPHFPVATTWNEVMDNLYSLLTEEHSFKTVVVDTLSELEVLIWKDLCDKYGEKNIGDIGGGFGRGYSYALDYWNEFRKLLDELNQKGMTIILTAHEGSQEVRDPENITYDRIAPQIHAKAEALLTRWCDNVFEARQKYRVKENNEGFSQTRGIVSPVGRDGGDRIIRTVGSPACIAKNRFNLPAELPLSYKAFEEAICG
jgi:hypothetical protein